VCPSGHYCPEGSISPTPCPPGKFTTATNNVELGDCIDCPGGYYCSSETELGMSNFGFECDEGYYCDGGDKVAKPYKKCVDPNTCPENKVCPKGHNCPNGSSDKRECLPG